MWEWNEAIVSASYRGLHPVSRHSCTLLQVSFSRKLFPQRCCVSGVAACDRAHGSHEHEEPGHRSSLGGAPQCKRMKITSTKR